MLSESILRTYRAGAVVETIQWPRRPQSAVRGSGTGRKPSSPKKVQDNELALQRRLARLVNANFSHGSCRVYLRCAPEVFQHIRSQAEQTCGDDPNACRQARLHLEEVYLRRFLRQVKSRCKKQGVNLAYIAFVTEVFDPMTERLALEYTLLVHRPCRDILTQLWAAHGTARSSRMPPQLDQTGLVIQLLRQVRKLPNAKRYLCSRNLIRPKPQDRRLPPKTQLHLPPGASIKERTVSTKWKVTYIRYTLPHLLVDKYIDIAYNIYTKVLSRKE